MMPIEEKIKRLAHIATMYYMQDQTQQEIANVIGVSRPMVSKLLQEAKELGIVSFSISQPTDARNILARQLERQFKLRRAIILKSGHTAHETNERIVQAAHNLCAELCTKPRHVGIGWGDMVGRLAEYAEQNKAVAHITGHVFPLIGGVKAPYRCYHPNELVRLISAGTGMSDTYLYMPAAVGSLAEKQNYEQSIAFQEVLDCWQRLSVALINPSNYPASPDLTACFRFGNRFHKQKAVGSFLAHYYDSEGVFIEPEDNNIMQISIHQLRKSENVVALCHYGLRPESAAGALKSGLITHVLMSDQLAMQLLHAARDHDTLRAEQGGAAQ